MADRRRYSADRYRSSGHFPPRLVLDVASRSLDLGHAVNVKGPEDLGQPAQERPVSFFNPSIVRAPQGLCPRCVFVASLRADVLHQCDMSTPLKGERGMPSVVQTNAFFKGSVIAVLDGRFNVLGWTWLLNAPEQQVSDWGMRSHRRRVQRESNVSDFWIPRGASDGFAPPWSAHAYDARLFEAGDGRLLATFVRSCHRHQPCHFAVSQVHITAQSTSTGGLSHLRAWAYPTVPAPQQWAQGRNQALFRSSSTRGGGDALMVLPWIGLVASFGVPEFTPTRVECAPWLDKRARARRIAPNVRRLNRAMCGTTPAASSIHLPILQTRHRAAQATPVGTAAPFGDVRLLFNHTARLRFGARPRRSLTAHLVTIRGRVGLGRGGGVCEALLGIGHLHRSEGPRNAKQMAAAERDGLDMSAPPFEFGADYDHFFFTLSPRPPYQPLAISEDFCLAAGGARGGSDCERVQFVSGVASVPGDGTWPEATEALRDASLWSSPVDGGGLKRPSRARDDGSAAAGAAGVAAADGAHLLLAYGVNDCEARVAKLDLSVVWAMLRPLAGEVSPCSATAP